MTIVINTRFLLKDYLEGYGYFIFETCSRMASLNPEHKFVFVFDRPVDQSFQFTSNVICVEKGPMARHPLLWWYWYNFSLPAVARKHKADVILCPDGFCSLSTKIPQCLVVHDLAFLHYPKHLTKSHLWFYKNYSPKFLAKAKRICTVSEFSKNDILTQYKISAEKIKVIYSGVSESFVPVDIITKAAVKEQYAQGHEYFLFSGAIQPRKNLLNLLKAFSLFKKRQKSGMKLIITGRLGWNYEAFQKKIAAYKYRDEVILTGYLTRSELVRITASAYAVVYPSLFEGFGVPPLEAMKTGVPVITSNNSSMPEISGEAALYADASDPASIAEQLMNIFRDEKLREELISKGYQRVKAFTWDNTATLLWDSILSASKN